MGGFAVAPYVFHSSNLTKIGIAVGFACVIGFGLISPALARDDILLTMKVGGNPPLLMDMADFDQLPQNDFTTETQWTEGEIAFSGPALKDVLELADPELEADTPVRLIAANQYEVTLDMDLLSEDAPIIATRMNGKTFGTRQNGPLWVVFPYDLDSRYQSEGVYSASIWQLIEIQIEK